MRIGSRFTGCKVDSLPCALFDFLEPCSWIGLAPEIWRKREDAAGKEGRSVTGRLTSHEKRAEPTIRKYGRSFWIGQQRVIASAQFGLTNDVECPLQCHSLSVWSARRS